MHIPKHIDDRISYLKSEGYVWDKSLSISCAGVVLVKGDDMYLFDLEFNEYHNPELLHIYLT